MTTAKKKLKAPKAEELSNEQIELLIRLAMLDRRYKDEKYLKCCKRMAFFCTTSPRLLPVLANEAWLMLKHLKALGVTPSYGRKTNAKSEKTGETK